MKNYDLERKIYNALKPHVMHKPKLMSVVWENNGGMRFNFLYFTKSPKIITRGYYSIQFPEEHFIEVEWPRQSDLFKLNPTFVNRRMGYIAMSTPEKFYG